MGKYLAPEQTVQMIRPVDVVLELMQTVSQLHRLFDVTILFLSASTTLLAALVLTLSLRLRRREIRTMYLLGCSRGKVVQVIATEWLLIILCALGSSFVVAKWASPVLEWIFLRLIST